MLLNDNVIDSRKFNGVRSIRRISEVVFDESSQTFTVRWLEGPETGTEKHGFATYADGVAYEVSRVNELRLACEWDKE